MTETEFAALDAKLNEIEFRLDHLSKRTARLETAVLGDSEAGMDGLAKRMGDIRQDLRNLMVINGLMWAIVMVGIVALFVLG